MGQSRSEAASVRRTSVMSEWLNMGGYAFYVWSSYAVSGITVLLLLIGPLLRRRRIVAEVKAMQARERRRRVNSEASAP